MIPVRLKSLSLVACLLPLLLLAGCSSTPPEIKPAVTVIPSDSIEELRLQIQRTQSPEREVYQLMLVQTLHEQGSDLEALNTLEQINVTRLDVDNRYRYATLIGDLYRNEGRLEEALLIIERPNREPREGAVDSQVMSDWLRVRGQLLSAQNRTVEAALNFHERQQFLRPEDRLSNHELILESLSRLPTASLAELAREQPESELTGWVDLAATLRLSGDDILQQAAAIDSWLARNPDHSAARVPPTTILKIRQLSSQQPERVGVLLPLSGNLATAGQSILEGILAAHYESKSRGNRVPELLFRDTNQADVILQYSSLILDGADMVIGPLDRYQLNRLANSPSAPLPIVGLNSISLPPSASNLVGLNLAIEDEAEQVALQGLLDGHRRALVIAPADSWGDRVVQTFEQVWSRNGGTVVASSRLPPGTQIAPLISDALLVDHSENRHQLLQQSLGQNLGFVARRRQDVDLVFLAAYPQQARQVKPLLDFYYASEIPVYATSTIYSGTPNPVLDRDLDTVKFLMTPWLSADTGRLYDLINQQSSPSPELMPLNAMGVDAYHLMQRAPMLESGASFVYRGALGTLTVQPSHNVKRELGWARFANGLIDPIEEANQRR